MIIYCLKIKIIIKGINIIIRIKKLNKKYDLIIYCLKIKIIIKGINIIIKNKKVKEKVRFDYLRTKIKSL